MKVIICGGRDYASPSKARDWLNRLLSILAFDHVIEGGAPGADRIARDWAMSKCLVSSTVPANWTEYGNEAGPIRNAKMLSYFGPDAVIALPGGVGTLDMVNQARAARLPVYLYPNLEPTP